MSFPGSLLRAQLTVRTKSVNTVGKASGIAPSKLATLQEDDRSSNVEKEGSSDSGGSWPGEDRDEATGGESASYHTSAAADAQNVKSMVITLHHLNCRPCRNRRARVIPPPISTRIPGKVSEPSLAIQNHELEVGSISSSMFLTQVSYQYPRGC